MTETLGADQDAVRAARPSGGVASVAAGLAVFGAATYAYLALAGRGLTPAAFGPLSVLWTLLNAIGIGLFLPFEQEIGRRTAALRAGGRGNAAVVRRALRAVAVLLGGVAVVTLAAIGPISSRVFAGVTVLVPLFVLAMVGMAASYVTRGLLSGNGRFGRYGAQLAADGVIRVVAAGVLYTAGVDQLAAYGLVLVVAPVLAVLVTTPSRTRLVADGPDPDPQGATSVLVTLVGASLLSQVLANAGPVVVQVLAGPQDAETSGQFTAALVIARVPLFAFAAVQAVLLPGLAALVGAGRTGDFRRRVALVGVLTVALGLAGTAGVWLVGDRLVPLLFGAGFTITRSVIALIALSGALFMVAQVLAQALLAVGLDRWVLIGWGAGVAGLLGALVRDLTLADRAAWSLVVGSAVALVVMLGALAVWDRRSAGARPEPAR